MLVLVTVFSILAMVLGLVYLVAAIIVLIQAFKADTTQGILCLCVPLYVIYYAFAKLEHPKKKMLSMTLVIAFAGLLICQVLSIVMGMMFAADVMEGGIPGYPGMTAYPGQTAFPTYPGMTPQPFPMTGFPMTPAPGTAP